MNAKRIFITLLVLVIVMTLGLSAVSAQMGGGRGGQGGNGGGAGSQNGQQAANQTGTQDGTGSQFGQAAGTGSQFGQAAAGTGNQFGQQNGTPGMNGSGLLLNLPDAVVDELPQDVIDLMIAGWLDEQHAYAVYESVLAQFGAVRPFSNILNSEAQHAAAWELLFSRYGVAVPELPAFDLPVFASAADACAVGASAEVANFDLYDTMMTAFAAYPDLTYVAQNLRDASEFSHLPAFENCAG